MNEDMVKIIEAGILAPSGENCQPWKVKQDGKRLYLYIDPTKDTSIYNYQQKGSMVACGAFIENAIVAAKSLGYSAKVDIDDGSKNNLVATISLGEKGSPQDDNLYQAIFTRATNRKAYKAAEISTEQKKEIIDCGVGDVKVVTLDDKAVIKKLSTPISLNEQLIFENKHIHDF